MNKNEMNPKADWVCMGNLYDFNSGEWGEIIYEESSTNRRKREAGSRNINMTLMTSGMMDLVFVGILVYLKFMTTVLRSLPMSAFLLLICVFVGYGVVTFIVGWSRLMYSAKPIVILEKGIVENRFTPFEEIPIIELQGAKQKIMLSRSGSAIMKSDRATAKDKEGYVKYIYLPEDLDFEQFKESLEKLGYGDEKKDEPRPLDKDAKGPSDNGPKDPETTDKK